MDFRVRFLTSAIALCLGWSQASAEEVDKVLRDWSAHQLAHPHTGVHTTARLYAYDDVFQTETRAVVEFWVRPSGESRIDFAPVQPRPEEVSRKIGHNGKPYSLEARRLERWVFTAQRMRQLFPDGTNHEVDLSPPKESDGFFERLLSPLQIRLASIGQLGFIIGDLQILLDDSQRKNWQIRLGSLHNSNDRIHLVLNPATEALSHTVSRLELLLNQADFTPIAIRSFDPAGTSENVYVYSRWKPLEADTDAFSETATARWPASSGADPRNKSAEDFPPPPPLAVMQ